MTSDLPTFTPPGMLHRWRVTTKPVGTRRKDDDAVGEEYDVIATRAEIGIGGHLAFWHGDTLKHVRAYGTFETVELQT